VRSAILDVELAVSTLLAVETKRVFGEPPRPASQYTSYSVIACPRPSAATHAMVICVVSAETIVGGVGCAGTDAVSAEPIADC